MPLLIDSVKIARRFQKSIRIDADLNDLSALEGFVCPRSSSNALFTMASTVHETGHGAFTWTGPYGSGKSSLVVALSAILGIDNKALDLVELSAGKNEVQKIRELLPPNNCGWNVLPIVGKRANPANVFLDNLIESKLTKKVAGVQNVEDFVLDELLRIASLRPKASGGLIVFIDEMGKFLEEAGKKSLDIYFFQRLAEASSRSNKRLIIVGILHQSFDEYANRLSREVRDEWSKIQGRFIDLPINTIGEEQVDLLSRAIEATPQFTKKNNPADLVYTEIKKIRPSVQEDFREKLIKCWPLHPVVTCLLGPISKRRFGQNQRSIFGFLNSPEPLGFQDFLKNTHLKSKNIYTPEKLWDYLQINLEPSILASPDGHRWSLAVDAIERCEALGGDALHVGVSKTIALIDLFKNRSGISASFEFLKICFPDHTKEELDEVLTDLKSWSVLIFKKHLNSYAIYAGSDFDIDQALSELGDDIERVDFKKLRSIAQLQPILAKRFYHKTGSLSWFDTDIIPVSEALSRVNNFIPKGGAIGQFLLLVPSEGETPKEAEEICKNASAQEQEWPSLLGLAQNSWYIESLAKEMIALEKIRIERPELEGDAVARREIDARIVATSSMLEEELKKSFSAARWYSKNHPPHAVGHSGLSFKASDLAFSIFRKSPRIQNELLNRIKPSASAVTAQKALLRLMVKKRGERRLGIDGFPAEAGLFDSLMHATHIYCYSEESKRWDFSSPPPEDTHGLYPLWRAAEKLLAKNCKRAISLQEIYSLWSSPPYGMKYGLLPIFSVAFLLTNRNRIAIYLDGVFRSNFDDYVIDCLTQDAGRVEIRWMDLPEMSRQILNGMADVVRQLDDVECNVDLEPIDVAKRLVAIVDSLPKWTLRTTRLSKNAQKIRDLIKHAHDPNKFLFDDIPGLFDEPPDTSEKAHVEAIVKNVSDGLEELKNAYPKMLDGLKGKMLGELNISGLTPTDFSKIKDRSEFIQEVRERAENIKEISGNFRLDAFINRIRDFVGEQEQMEGIASLAANKPPRDWIDRDIDQASIEIADLVQQFNRIEAFARVQGRADKRHAIAVVVSVDGSPEPRSIQFDYSTKENKTVEELIRKLENLFEKEGLSKEMILATIANLSAKVIGP